MKGTKHACFGMGITRNCSRAGSLESAGGRRSSLDVMCRCFEMAGCSEC